MATTYELIASQTLGSDTASVTFSSIPGTFDDLVLQFSIRCDRPDVIGEVWLRLNGATSNASLSSRILRGNGSSASSSNVSYGHAAYVPGTLTTANVFGSASIYIPEYTSNVQKSWSGEYVSENNATLGFVAAVAGLYASTSSITSVEILADTVFTHSMLTGSSFFLYGITKA